MALSLLDADEIIEVSDADLGLSDDKDVTYKVRVVTQDKYREIVKQHTKFVPNRRTHQKDEVTDWQAVVDDAFDYCLADWSGIVYKGAPAPCTSEYKKLLDGERKTAITNKAGANRFVSPGEVRAESFRAASPVE